MQFPNMYWYTKMWTHMTCQYEYNSRKLSRGTWWDQSVHLFCLWYRLFRFDVWWLTYLLSEVRPPHEGGSLSSCATEHGELGTALNFSLTLLHFFLLFLSPFPMPKWPLVFSNTTVYLMLFVQNVHSLNMYNLTHVMNSISIEIGV